MRRSILITALCLFSLVSTNAFAVPSAQLTKLIESIQREEVAYQSQVLKNQLDGTPLDKEALPLKDPVSGAINIEGETPRDKLVTELVRRIDLVSAKVREAQIKQDELFAKLRSSRGSVSEVVVELLTATAEKRYFPILFEVHEKALKLNTFEALVTRGVSEKLTLVRTVLETGKQTLHIKGTFAIGTQPDDAFFANRERFYIDQDLLLEVKAPSSRFLYKIVGSDDLRSLEQVRDKE